MLVYQRVITLEDKGSYPYEAISAGRKEKKDGGVDPQHKGWTQPRLVCHGWLSALLEYVGICWNISGWTQWSKTSLANIGNSFFTPWLNLLDSISGGVCIYASAMKLWSHHVAFAYWKSVASTWKAGNVGSTNNRAPQLSKMKGAQFV